MFGKHPISKPTFWGILIVLWGITAVFLGSLHTLSQSGDSLAYLWSASTGEDLFHPHHIIYNPVLYWLLKLVPSMGVTTVAQLHNIGFTLMALGILYGLAIYRFGKVWIGALGYLSMLLGIDTIRYSLYAEVYWPATAFVLLLVGQILIYALPQKPWQYLLLAFSLFMAVGYHQSNVLLILPLGMYAYAVEKGRGALKIGLVSLISGIPMLLLYVVGTISKFGSFSFDSFIQFTFLYAQTSYVSWGSWQNISLYGIVSLLNSQTDVFIYQGSDIFSIITLAVLIGQGYYLWKRLSLDTWRLLLWSIIIVYYLFFLWWLPQEEEFFIVTAPFLVLLFFQSGVDIFQQKYVYRFRWYGLGIFCGLVLVLFTMANVPVLNKSISAPSPQSIRAKEMVTAASPGCELISDHPDTFWYILLEGKRELRGIEPIQAFYYLGQGEDPRFKDAPCLLFPLRILDPTFRSIPISEAQPSAWQKYLYAIFSYKPLRLGRAEMRDFEFIQGEEGRVYISILTTKRNIESNLWETLDTKAQAQGIEPLFQEWAALEIKDL